MVIKRGLDNMTAAVIGFILSIALFGSLFGLARWTASQDASDENWDEPETTDVDDLEQPIEESPGHDQDGPEKPAGAPEKPKVKWGYHGSEGPRHWSSLHDDFHLCRDGKSQSPIDIVEASKSSKLLPLRFRYFPAEVQLQHKGHTLQADYQIGSYLEIDGDRFDLKQLHFHTPSEHAVDGSSYEMEVHLVHRSGENKVAVLAVLVEKSSEDHPALILLWRDLPRKKGDRGKVIEFHPAKLLPGRKTYYNYSGSYTTPPCAEGVRWYVLTQPIAASSSQIERFVDIVKFNARPQQPRGRRKVFRSLR